MAISLENVYGKSQSNLFSGFYVVLEHTYIPTDKKAEHSGNITRIVCIVTQEFNLSTTYLAAFIISIRVSIHQSFNN